MGEMIDRAAPLAHLRTMHPMMHSGQRRVAALRQGLSIWR